jgi:hypothetical protein
MSNPQIMECVGWASDDRTGEKIYGYVMDSCADENYWCQDDTYHLDFSQPYLSGMGLTKNAWNGRKIMWQYIDDVPSGCDPDTLPS